ncbi:hypothetical protein [Pseudokineococcus lusitanus]|nr:hypothetical protein [Pseudokineococcus lusitanus]
MTAEDGTTAAPDRQVGLALPRWLWGLGMLSLCAATALVVGGLGSHKVPFVIGGVVPRLWWAFLFLHVTGFVLLCCAPFARWHQEEADPSLRRSPGDAVLVAVATVPVYLVSLAAVGAGLLLATISSYSVLAPASDGGCRVVVREGSLLLLAAGEVYLLSAGEVRGREVSSYWADDGYMPFSGGTYTLRWDGETALLDVRGVSGQEVSYESVPLHCGRSSLDG